MNKNIKGENCVAKKMSDNEMNETFDLDDKRAEIVPAIQKTVKGKSIR